MNNREKQSYCAPKAESLELSYRLYLLTNFSLSGNVGDYEGDEVEDFPGSFYN